MSLASRSLRVPVDDAIGAVSALLLRPPRARALYVLAHGAGAGMEHPFMDAIARRLADRGIATFRYRFPYMEAGRKRPDRAPILQATVRAALDTAARTARGLPIVAGGKSMGGRMTSLLMADEPHPAVAGLAFLGFPLHAAGKPSAQRGEHLARVAAPMLFLQGTRDRLADLALIRPLVESLGVRAALHVVDGGDHSFQVLKRSGRTHDEALDELAGALAAWVDRIVSARTKA